MSASDLPGTTAPPSCPLPDNCWNTVYTDAAIDHLTAHGTTISSDQQRRLSPAVRDHINPYGRYDFDHSAQPTDGKLRPLRT